MQPNKPYNLKEQTLTPKSLREDIKIFSSIVVIQHNVPFNFQQ